MFGQPEPSSTCFSRHTNVGSPEWHSGAACPFHLVSFTRCQFNSVKGTPFIKSAKVQLNSVGKIIRINKPSDQRKTVWAWVLSARISVLFCCSVMSDSLQPHGLQHAMLPCHSPSPGVCSNSWLLSQWCHTSSCPLLSPSPPAFNLSQHQDRFQSVGSFHHVAKGLEFQLQHQTFQWKSGLVSFRIDWYDLLAVQGTLKSLPQHYSLKASILQCSAFFVVQLSHPYMTTRKTVALTIWTFVRKVMSLLFNMFSRSVIAFLPRNKCLLISWLHSPSAVILEPKKIKSLTVSTVSPSICHKLMGPDAMILVFECWVLSQLLHFPLSPSRGSLVPLCFLP